MNGERSYYFLQKARIVLIPGFLLLLLVTGCTTPKNRHIRPAFYFWKTNFRTGAYERQLMQGIGAHTLYLRLFDVSWDERQQQAAPLGVLQSDSIKDTSLQYIPVIYVTQSCLTRLKEEDLPLLTARVDTLAGQLCRRYGIVPTELQLDCDWTRSSANLYFSLLQQLRRRPFFKDKLLSCTIRLHQVKYVSASGLPPVDKGLLMVYNMGNLTRYGKHNSILDPGEARQYLKRLALYPLPLDVALPTYHWAVLFEREQFKGILYNLSREQFGHDDLRSVGGNLYRLEKTGTWGGYRLVAGQEIRFEQPSRDDLEEMAGYIGSRIRDSSYRVAFFHLDSTAIQPYQPADLKTILQAF
ncbi:hypothetical protein [Taibaiella koreensis]|uniref:hypothetical protein n=1 Tax=Taibaiella koreensis TaxID=1268548 RepID=UPI000E59FE70|nr:hypothetical protein [Taibaiella koreensis]